MQILKNKTFIDTTLYDNIVFYLYVYIHIYTILFYYTRIIIINRRWSQDDFLEISCFTLVF